MSYWTSDYICTRENEWRERGKGMSCLVARSARNLCAITWVGRWYCCCKHGCQMYKKWLFKNLHFTCNTAKQFTPGKETTNFCPSVHLASNREHSERRDEFCRSLKCGADNWSSLWVMTQWGDWDSTSATTYCCERKKIAMRYLG